MMKTFKKAIFPVVTAFVIVLIILIFQVAFKNAKSETKPQELAKIEFSVETFRIGENGWGYNILRNKKLIIKQDIIPAIEKQVTFKSEEDAQKTGLLVVEKIKKNQLPTISRKDLEDLKIDFLSLVSH